MSQTSRPSRPPRRALSLVIAGRDLNFEQQLSQQSAPKNKNEEKEEEIPNFDFSELDRVSTITRRAGYVVVYKVKQRSTGCCFYALKVITVNVADPVMHRQILRREMDIMRGLNHPNIVKCLGLLDNNDGEIQLLLDFVDGGSLSGICITDESLLSNIARQILSAVAYLHSQRMVHRHIKPANLWFDSSQNSVKVAGFGPERILELTAEPVEPVSYMGYVSPERISTDIYGSIYDGFAGDIWSFGLSLLEIHLGGFPMTVERHGDWASLMEAISVSPPPEARPTASGEFRNFVSCCLQKDAARRWSAVQLLHHPFILQNQMSH